MSKLKILILLSVVVGIYYGSSLLYGFSQDDYFHLTISRANNIGAFLNFFNPLRVDWIFFRPLSTQLPYFVAFSLFGLQNSPVILHFFMLLIHAVNAYLIVRIARHYLSKSQATILGFLYAVASFHFLSLYYIGAIQQLLSTLFSLLTILVFLRARTNIWLLAIFTLCALLSKELALRLPLLLLAWSWLDSKNLFTAIKRTFVPLVITILYLCIRIFIQTGGASEYLLNFSPATTLATLMWYGLFGIGFPELILHYGLSGGMVNFLTFFSTNPLVRLPILFAVIPLTFIIIKRLFQIRRSNLIFPLLALLSLAPVLFLPTHRYPHYLDISFLFFGIWIMQANVRLTLRHYVVVISVFLGMFASLRLEESTHWTTKRARLAKEATTWIMENDACNSPQGVRFVGSSIEMREYGYALSLSNGPHIICNNYSLPVYYSPND